MCYVQDKRQSQPRAFVSSLKRFYVSVWTTFEGYQHARPPAAVVSVIAKNRAEAEASVKQAAAARAFQVYDTVEMSVELPESITFEDWRLCRV
jgi:hypothetical protein